MSVKGFDLTNCFFFVNLNQALSCFCMFIELKVILQCNHSNLKSLVGSSYVKQ